MRANSKKANDEKANLEKDLLLNPEKVAEAKKAKKKKIIIGIVVTLLAIVGILLGALQIVRAVGKNNLKNKAKEVAPVMAVETKEEEVITEKEQVVWQEGWVKYNDKIYAYNEDIMTFLIMGIDKDSDVKEVAEGTKGGQADAIFLVVLNPHDNSMNIIGINRNTIADVDIYNEDGAYVETMRTQIAIQHGFGNGVEESCEYQEKAVSKLMYSLPIHGYAAINMKAIPKLNDAVGGVDLVVLEDVKNDKNTIILREGEGVHLENSQAYWYVRDRDTNEFGSADNRLARQRQYLSAFMSKALSAVKEDKSVATELYSEIQKQMVTNVTIDEVAYLAPLMSNYDFNAENFQMIKGETRMGEVYEEYYVDEDALYDMVIRMFYEEVK